MKGKPQRPEDRRAEQVLRRFERQAAELVFPLPPDPTGRLGLRERVAHALFPECPEREALIAAHDMLDQLLDDLFAGPPGQRLRWQAEHVARWWYVYDPQIRRALQDRARLQGLEGPGGIREAKCRALMEAAWEIEHDVVPEPEAAALPEYSAAYNPWFIRYTIAVAQDTLLREQRAAPPADAPAAPPTPLEQLEATETQEQEARQVAAFLEARPPRERELAELALAHPGAGFAELAQLMRPTAAGTPPAEATVRVWFHRLVSSV